MTNAADVLEELRLCGGSAYLEAGKLQIEAPDTLDIQLLALLKQSKEQIVMLLDAEQKARASGWLILSPEAFSKQIDRKTEIFLFWDLDGWKVWRGTSDIDAKDSAGNKLLRKPLASEKTLAERVQFDEAMQRAENYISWRRNGQRKQAV